MQDMHIDEKMKRASIDGCDFRGSWSVCCRGARFVACLTALVLLGACGAMPGRTQTLVPIGGGLERANTASFDAMLAKTRPGTRIVIAPFASGEADEAFARARDNFLFHDAAAIVERMADPTQGPEELARAAKQIEWAQLIFMTGGDQSRLTPRFRDAQGELNAAGSAMYRSDLLVAGTSAGAAIMADPMFTGGGSESALANLASNDADEPGARGVQLGVGLGASGNLLIDTHVLVRGRYGRMFAALKKGDHVGALGLADASAAIVQRSGEESTARILHDHGAILCWLDTQQRGERIGTLDVGEQLGARISLLCEGDSVSIAYGADRSARVGLVVGGGKQGTGGMRGGSVARGRYTPRPTIVPTGARTAQVADGARQANALKQQRSDAARDEGKVLDEQAWDEGALVDCLLRLAAEPTKAFATSSERFIVRVWADGKTTFFVKENGAVTIWSARIDIRMKDNGM